MTASAQVATLIVDDEPVARAGLRQLLAEIDWVTVVGEAANGPETIAAIDSLKPELVFLDVQMPGLSGIEVLRQLRCLPRVIFTTAYAEHAVTAFELGAIDYLLKPFGEERLRAALERARDTFGEPRASLDRFAEAARHGPMTRLFVRTGRNIVPLAVTDVTRFEAVGDYIAAHAGAAQHLLHLSLGQLEQRLDPARFARIHRGHIVNLDHVTAFRHDIGGQMHAELRDGTTLPVSRTKARALRDKAR